MLKTYQAEADNPVEGGNPAEGGSPTVVDNRDNPAVVGTAEMESHLDCILAAGEDSRRSIDY